MKLVIRLTGVIAMFVFFACTKQSGQPSIGGKLPTAAAANEDEPPANLIFKTNFDNPNTTNGSIVTAFGDPAETQDITGSNSPININWNTANSNFGNAFHIQYLGAASHPASPTTDRRAVVTTDDPVNGQPSTNGILKFAISYPNDRTEPKGRIQANLYGVTNPNDANKPYKQLYQSVKMKLHYSSFAKILADHNRLIDGSGDWITLFEFWNNNNWSSPYPFRISVNLVKKKPYATGTNSDQFQFYIKAQKTVSTTNLSWDSQDLQWTVTSPFIVPLGQWMTVEIYMKEGDAANGQFWLAVKPDNDPNKTIIADKTGITYSRYDPNPDGISQWNPMKLYTSDEIINLVHGTPNSKDLQVYWDEFKVYDKKPY